MKKKILIADDSFYQRKVLSDIVKGLGYEYDDVGSGEELLEQITDEYDCIFLDLLMNGMSGIDVLEELKKRGNTIPVIVISADIQQARIDECMSLGAKKFLQKITSKEALEEALNSIFN